MSLEDNRLRKRIGTAAFLDMKAKEYVNNLQDSGNRITHMFDISSTCIDINSLVLSNPLNNYYEYKITDLSGAISDTSKFYFPREFYLTGIQLINRKNTILVNPKKISIIVDDNIEEELINLQSKHISLQNQVIIPVKKIRKIKQTDYLKFEKEPEYNSDTHLIFNGFM